MKKSVPMNIARSTSEFPRKDRKAPTMSTPLKGAPRKMNSSMNRRRANTTMTANTSQPMLSFQDPRALVGTDQVRAKRSSAQPMSSVVRNVARMLLTISGEKLKRSAPTCPSRYPRIFTRTTHTAVNSTVRFRRRQMTTVMNIVRAVRMSESGQPRRAHRTTIATCSAANP